jgi:hypothetical protein
MKFKVFIISIFYLLISDQSILSQEQSYTDLLVYYVDEDYEKCIKKAEKYLSKDEYRNDPLPLLYSAMSYYEMSRDNKYAEDYPKAYRNCLNYLSKYRRKDEDYLHKRDAQPFIEKIKGVVAEEIENYKLDGTARSDRKIISLLKKLKKIDPDDSGIKLMLGVYYVKSKNRSEGREYITKGTEGIMTIGDSIVFGELTKTQQLFFKEGIVAYYNLKKDRNPEEAKEVLLLGVDFFAEDREDCYIENRADFLKIYENLKG